MKQHRAQNCQNKRVERKPHYVPIKLIRITKYFERTGSPKKKKKRKKDGRTRWGGTSLMICDHPESLSWTVCERFMQIGFENQVLRYDPKERFILESDMNILKKILSECFSHKAVHWLQKSHKDYLCTARKFIQVCNYILVNNTYIKGDQCKIHIYIGLHLF